MVLNERSGKFDRGFNQKMRSGIKGSIGPGGGEGINSCGVNRGEGRGYLAQLFLDLRRIGAGKYVIFCINLAFLIMVL